MKRKTLRSVSIIILFFTITQCNSSSGEYPEQLDKLVAGTTLIFKAKVLVLHTVTTEEDDVTDAGVVVVSEIIEAPEAFQNISGQEVTVHFTEINKMSVGEERIFFTDPYWIGESIGVREIGSIAKDDKLYENKEISSYIKQARDKQSDEQLRKTLKESTLVVSGRVMRVNVPEGYQRMATEHDPEWKEAEIQVDEFIKGKAEGKTVKILFASTKDMMFLESPKFKEGDEGIFIAESTDTATLKMLRNENMILQSSSFIRGKEKTKHVKSLLK